MNYTYEPVDPAMRVHYTRAFMRLEKEFDYTLLKYGTLYERAKGIDIIGRKLTEIYGSELEDFEGVEPDDAAYKVLVELSPDEIREYFDKEIKKIAEELFDMAYEKELFIMKKIEP